MPRRIKNKKFKSLGVFMPEDFLDEILPAKTWGKNFIVGAVGNMHVQRQIVKTLIAGSAIKQKDLTSTITNVLTGYKHRARLLEKQGVRAYKAEAINNEALLKQRVSDALVYAEVVSEKKKHNGQYYRWLPSAAENPDPEHQTLYGQVFKVGDGDKDGNMPGERFGCQCGIEWLTDDDSE